MSREHDVVTLSGAEYDALLSEAEEAARLREELAALRAAPQCCMCGKTGLSTVEGDGGSECQLSDGRWTCSFECWERATERAALTARAEAAEAALRESEANRILLDALVAELKAEKQPTLGRFATLLRRATTKVNRAALQWRDGQ